jgi:hypothetical protein
MLLPVVRQCVIVAETLQYPVLNLNSEKLCGYISTMNIGMPNIFFSSDTCLPQQHAAIQKQKQ